VTSSGTKYPESINRVMDLTGKHVTFYEADLCNKDSLRQVAIIHNRVAKRNKPVGRGGLGNEDFWRGKNGYDSK
jgi:hypothetical protein